MSHVNPQGPVLDHLVVAAPTLAAGVRWCEHTLGITPGPGGEHALMGTHNRLALLASNGFPGAYLEIIAINPGAAPTKANDQARWFGFDEPERRARLHALGPQLIHWVARVNNLPSALAQCQRSGVDLGPAVSASRMTAQGLLAWSIAIRGDGQLQFDGIMPTLISWGSTHPTQNMPVSKLGLRGLTCRHPQAEQLNSLWQSLGGSARFEVGPAGLCAELDTPKGPVLLHT